MGELHDALDMLGQLDFHDVPQDNLEPFLQKHFAAAELICNSVPPPPGGEDASSFRPSQTEADSAHSAKEVIASNARFPEACEEHVSLQHSWGKAIKMSTKDNPLDVHLYKMASHDRHGTWFARRSVHEGISFDKMERAMKREFVESMAVKGGPGAGAIRGIAVDNRIEQIKVDKSSDLQVFQLSAQFPGPTTPREFIAMLMSSTHALSPKSTNGAYIPRHFMVVSRPVHHPACPERSGYVHASYESIELIREIPMHLDKSASSSDLRAMHDHPGSRDRGNTISFAESRGQDAKGEQLDKNHGEHSQPQLLNPFEWINISRSDPGGGIPRFMVERGSPSSIIQDVGKLLDWACAKRDLMDPHQDEIIEEMEHKAAEAGSDQTGENAKHDGEDYGDAHAYDHSTEQPSSTNGAPPEDTPPVGIVDHAKQTIGAGVAAVLPSSVADLLMPDESNDHHDASSAISSVDEDAYVTAESDSEESSPPMSEIAPSTLSTSPESTRLITGHKSIDKEIYKIDQNKKKLDEKMAKKRDENAKRLTSMLDASATQQELKKMRDKQTKEMTKAEEENAKKMQKLDAKREKEIDKARKKAAKQSDKEMISLVSRERDDYRRRLELMQQENELLRSQVGAIQKENSALVARLGKYGSSETMLLREETAGARRRAGTAGSMRSGNSGSSSRLGEGS